MSVYNEMCENCGDDHWGWDRLGGEECPVCTGCDNCCECSEHTQDRITIRADQSGVMNIRVKVSEDSKTDLRDVLGGLKP